MSKIYRATNSMLPTNGPDAQDYATRWDGQYCQSIPSDGEYTGDFSIVWNVKDMDFEGGPNGILWIKGRDLFIQHIAHNLLQVAYSTSTWEFLHSDTRGEWRQFALIRNGHWLQLWEGGNKINELDLGPVEPIGGSNVLIGYTNKDRFFRGNLFDLRIYKDVALTKEDLQYLYTDARTYQGERTLPRVNYGQTPRASD